MKALAELERRHPEWRAWLAGLAETLEQLGDPAWEAAVPAPGPARDGAPLLAGAGLDAAHLPLALLHACRRRWSAAVPQGWSRGYCPVCGAWPGFAELCGVERSRFLRCVRCGAAWRSQGLACPYCANRDHGALGSLVAEEGAPRWTIEVCRRCRGYLKVFTALRPAAPETLLLEDLKTIELDLAAEQRGYRRPQGAGYELHVAA